MVETGITQLDKSIRCQFYALIFLSILFQCTWYLYLNITNKYKSNIFCLNMHTQYKPC